MMTNSDYAVAALVVLALVLVVVLMLRVTPRMLTGKWGVVQHGHSIKGSYLHLTPASGSGFHIEQVVNVNGKITTTPYGGGHTYGLRGVKIAFSKGAAASGSLSLDGSTISLSGKVKLVRL